MPKNTPRPHFRKNDKITSLSIVPAYDGKPQIGRDTELSVSHVTGRGSKCAPWRVVATDGIHFWHFDPENIVRA